MNSTQAFRATLARDIRRYSRPTRLAWRRMNKLQRLYWRIRLWYYRQAWEREKANG